MNKLKIQTEILKGLLKGLNVIYTTEHEGMIGLCPDEYCVVFCPIRDVYLKLNGTLFDIGKTLKKTQDDEYRLSESVQYFDYDLDGKKVRLMKVTSEDRSACVNEKYTKYFDKDALYYVSSWNRPVMVFEQDQMVGLIFPVVVKNHD